MWEWNLHIMPYNEKLQQMQQITVIGGFENKIRKWLLEVFHLHLRKWAKTKQIHDSRAIIPPEHLAFLIFLFNLRFNQFNSLERIICELERFSPNIYLSVGTRISASKSESSSAFCKTPKQWCMPVSLALRRMKNSII